MGFATLWGMDNAAATKATGGKWIVEVWFATSREPRDIGRADTRELALREARQYVSDARRVRIISPTGQPEEVR